MKKRFFILLLALVMVWPLLPTEAMATGAWPFSDVNESNVPIRYVYEKGIMNGTGNGQFSPDQLTTRAPRPTNSNALST